MKIFLFYRHLEGNSLESLPNEIGDLKCLQVLNVVSNNLTHIPGSVGNLKTLKKLQISNNHLLYLPDGKYIYDINVALQMEKCDIK